MNRLVDATNIPSATPHDLRRTGATNLTSERIGVSRFIVSKVLAHSGDTGGAAAVTGQHYDLNDYFSEKRKALDAWAAVVLKIVSIEGAKNAAESKIPRSVIVGLGVAPV